MEDNKKRIIELEIELEVAKFREAILKQELQKEIAKKAPVYWTYPYTWPWPNYSPYVGDPPVPTGPIWKVTLPYQTSWDSTNTISFH